MENAGERHISDTDFERYAMNSLPEVETATLEEHLLVCPECQDRLQEADAHVRAMQAAARRLRQEEQNEKVARWPAWFRPAWGLALAAAMAALIVVGVRTPGNTVPVAVMLEASRGPLAAHAPAPAGKPLTLKMDLAELPAAPGYHAEVVDQTGRRLWEGAAAIRAGRAAVDISKPLPAGRYYVRLYSASSELLREYGLEVN